MIHHLKISDKFADAVLNGDKTFEVRYNDRGYNKGDKIVFTVVDSSFTYAVTHPLTDKMFEITYVLSGWGIKVGYVVFGIKSIA